METTETDCFLLHVTAGAGPAEVRAFVAKLVARLEARCLAAGVAVVRVDDRGGPGGPRSVTLTLRGAAVAALASELGTHALVARSSQRGRSSRKRWYAGVSLRPVSAECAVQVDPDALTVTAMRASGPGGQRVNKVASAVRVRHDPTGLVVKASEERSQRENLRLATARIAARLAAREHERRRAQEDSLRGEHRALVRGAPVRTYREGPRGALVADDG